MMRQLKLKILSVYVIRLFLIWVGLAMLVCLLIGFLGELSDVARDIYKQNDGGLWLGLQFSLMRLPALFLDMLPFIILFGSVFFFAHCKNTNELVIARVAGLSVWQFLATIFGVAFGVGLFAVFVISPIATKSMSHYNDLRFKNDVVDGRNLTHMKKGGFWMKESVRDDGDGKGGELIIIYASKIHSYKPPILGHMTMLTIGRDDDVKERIDAKKAYLKQGEWVLENVLLFGAAGLETYEALSRETRLEQLDYFQSLAYAENIHFWNLLKLGREARRKGFADAPYKMRYYGLVSLPFLLVAMVLVAASFGLSMDRMVGTGWILLKAILAGLVLYFLTELMKSLGASNMLPPFLAAFCVPLIAGLLGAAMLLSSEDG